MESERETRKKRIDYKLRLTNPKWIIIPYKQGLDINDLTNHAVEEYPTSEGWEDYALCL